MRDGIHVALGTYAHVVMTVAVGIALVRVWGADARGLIAVVIAFPDIAVMIGDFGQSKAVPYAIGHAHDATHRIVGVLLMLWILVSALFLIGMVLYFGLGAAEAPWLWVVLGAATIPPSLFINYARGVALGLQEMGFFARLFWVRDPIILACVLIAAVFGLPVWTYFIALLVSYGIVSILCIRLIANHTQVRLIWDWRRAASMIRTGVKFSLGGILMRLNYRFGIILLTLAVFMIPRSDIANFTVGVALAQMLWQLPIALNQVLFSRSVNTKDPEGFSRKTARLVRVAMLLAIPMAVVVYLVAPWAIPLVYGSEIDQAGRITQILLPGIVAFFAARTFEADLIAKGRPWDVVSVMAPVVLVNVALNLRWIPEHGIYGAAWASTVSYTLGTIAMTVVYSRRVGMSLWEVITPRRSDFDFPFVRRLLSSGGNRDE